MEYTTFIVGRNTEIRLPKIDITWSGIHNEKPFMLYPGEVCKEYADDKGKRYCISNYCRVWSYRHNDFLKGINSEYMPKIFRDNFSDNELDNEITQYNLSLYKKTKEYRHNYYMRNRETRLAYQREYDKNKTKTKHRANSSE